jgi:hypothetical protein
MSDYVAELIDVRRKSLFAFCCFLVLYHDPSVMIAFPFSIIKESFMSHGRSTPPLPESFQRLILLSVRLLSDSVVLELEHRNPNSPDVPCLSELLMHYAARVRTDLDRFSNLEISALMFHGYSVAELALLRNTQSRGWIEKEIPKPTFRSADAGTNILWEAISKTLNWPDDAETAKRQLETV